MLKFYIFFILFLFSYIFLFNKQSYKNQISFKNLKIQKYKSNNLKRTWKNLFSSESKFSSFILLSFSEILFSSDSLSDSSLFLRFWHGRVSSSNELQKRKEEGFMETIDKNAACSGAKANIKLYRKKYIVKKLRITRSKLLQIRTSIHYESWNNGGGGSHTLHPIDLTFLYTVRNSKETDEKIKQDSQLKNEILEKKQEIFKKKKEEKVN